MKAYFISIVTAAVISGIVTSLAPKGKDGGIAKHVKLLSSLALLCLAAAPVASFVSSLDPGVLARQLEISETDGSEKRFAEIMSEFTASELEKAVEEKVCEKFGLGDNDVNASAVYETSDTVRFTRITVTLSGKGIFASPYLIEAYVEELTGLPVDCGI